MRLLLPLPPLAALLLSGCGTLPQPFNGHPGANALRLASPPPARLDVPVPTASLLSDADARRFAHDLSDALVTKEVPAIAQPVRPGDWHLDTVGRLQGGQVVPSFRVLGPDNKVRASRDGSPVPAELWSHPDPALLSATAKTAAESINAMLLDLRAAQLRADPSSLFNRSAKIFFTGVTGAPGDGDISLGRQMAVSLPDSRDELVHQAAGADFTVSGLVKVAPPEKNGGQNMQHVEITWTVVNKLGHEAGKVSQLNEVPAGTLDGYWGDVAVVVCQEAALGIREVITNNAGLPKRAVPANGGTGSGPGKPLAVPPA
ncbi:hypothetical protein [Rhizosaccharibacter radicis]|uniref:Lipoprotein n=1 Tax=Rhizosaccharibacter radicis TaxID=2782605 RepID=A0ABT1VZH1_9PROT|nr:hypothetical protein [Acetobacteraceae bacterium KSS12]